MGHDLVLRGGLVVDGTGGPRRHADVAITGDRISAIGRIDSADADAEIDVTGLVVAPGFIDLHTHYDAQIMWDPALTPSSWYGVTTVVLGSCGFGIAPMPPDQRETMLRTLETVEDMPIESLKAGVRWDFETFGEYVDEIARLPLAVNVGAYVGHTPARYAVLRGEAAERSATEAEIRDMAEIIEEAMRAGAMGLATSVAQNHTGADGRPVPSRLGDFAELEALCEAVGRTGKGCIMIAGPGGGVSFREFGRLSEKSGRPLMWAALFAEDTSRGTSLELLEAHSNWAGQIRPQVSCRPLVSQVQLSNPFTLNKIRSFEEVSLLPADERMARYSDSEWRSRARTELDEKWGNRWDLILVSETDIHTDVVGRSLGSISRDTGQHPADIMFDLALAEGLKTRFTTVLANYDESKLELLLKHPRAILGLSDAGAHLGQIFDACFAPYLLEHWVRDLGVLDLETAIWRLSGEPAEFLGLQGRGTIVEDGFADIVVLDPERIGVAAPRRVLDLPGGASRLVADPEGIEHIWVNGKAIRSNGVQHSLSTAAGRFVRPE